MFVKGARQLYLFPQLIFNNYLHPVELELFSKKACSHVADATFLCIHLLFVLLRTSKLPSPVPDLHVSMQRMSSFPSPVPQ